MGIETEIPKEDLDLINKSFERRDSIQIIKKDYRGSKLSSGRRTINENSFVLENFGGRVLKHQKEVHDGVIQKVVAVRGQEWEKIPKELRESVAWFDSDFE